MTAIPLARPVGEYRVRRWTFPCILSFCQRCRGRGPTTIERRIEGAAARVRVINEGCTCARGGR